MIKTFSYSDENNEFLDMEQNNYFFEGEDCKILKKIILQVNDFFTTIEL